MGCYKTLGGNPGWVLIAREQHHRFAVADATTAIFPPLNTNWTRRTLSGNTTSGSIFKLTAINNPTNYISYYNSNEETLYKALYRVDGQNWKLNTSSNVTLDFLVNLPIFRDITK